MQLQHPVIAGVGGYIVNTYNSTTKETRYPNGAVAGAICWSIVTEPGNDYCAWSAFSKPEVNAHVLQIHTLLRNIVGLQWSPLYPM